MKREASLLRGLMTGAAAGLVGCLAMSGFQELVARSTEAESSRDNGPHAPSPGEDNTTEKAARNVARQFGRDLSVPQKQLAGRLLHYGFGTAMGATYGAAAEYLPLLGLGAGTAFGTMLFFGTDEGTLPLLGLAQKPADTPPADHMLHWASHIAYSITMEVTRRALVSRFGD